MLVLFSVVFLGEHLTMRTSLGFCVAMVGVILYKAVPKGAPEGEGCGMRRMERGMHERFGVANWGV